MKREYNKRRNWIFKVRLTKAELDELLEAAGSGNRSEFIRKAIRLQIAQLNAAFFETKAIDLGFAYPEDALKMLGISAAEITDNKTTGLKDVLTELAKSGRLRMIGE